MRMGDGEKRRSFAGILLQTGLWTAGAMVLCAVLRGCGRLPAHGVFPYVIFGMIGGCIGALWATRCLLAEHPEIGFLIVALSAGGLMATLEPVTMGYSWDDEIHYRHVLQMVHLGKTDWSAAEEFLIRPPEAESLEVSGRVRSRSETAAALDGMNRAGEAGGTAGIPDAGNLPGYLTSWMAMLLMRAVHAPVSWCVIAGRWGNLLGYAALMVLAIRSLKRGKLAASMMGLLPTMLFLAANYSYDPFFVAATFCGVCIWLGTLQEDGARMTLGRGCAAVALMMLGIGIKQIYFPLLFLLFFVPRERFASGRDRAGYTFMVIAAIAVVLASFLMPFLRENTSYSDVRGGENVNAGQQLALMAKNPLAYLQVLGSFFTEVYFQPHELFHPVRGCIGAFSALGRFVPFWSKSMYLYVLLLLLSWVAPDKGPSGGGASAQGQAACVLLGAGTLALVATSMYMAYTEVGSELIEGCQERYMIPVVWIWLIVLRPAFRFGWRRERGVPVLFFAAAACLLAGMHLLIRPYLS